MAAPQTSTNQALDETDPAKPQEFSEEDDRLFLALENYCWEADPEFQAGLTQILSTASSHPSQVPEPSQVRLLTRQAKCFFYSRKIRRAISFPLYSAWLDREEASGPRCHSPSCEVGPPIDPTPIGAESSGNPACPDDTPNATPDESTTTSSAEEGSTKGASAKEDANTPYPTSFAQIVDLITSGKPIPGIREIPNNLNPDPPSQSTLQQRRKPWEVLQEGGGQPPGELSLQ